jgi:hypothetical protein
MVRFPAIVELAPGLICTAPQHGFVFGQTLATSQGLLFPGIPIPPDFGIGKAQGAA